MDTILTNRTARPFRVLLVLVLLGVTLIVAPPAQGEPIVGNTRLRSSSPFTELTVGPITGEYGQSNITAYNTPADFNPLSGYPTAVPAGSTRHDLGYAGLIPALDSEGNQAFTYCIDLFTSTQTGVTYQRDDWTEANVRNIGYVGYILRNYHPTTDAPTGPADNVKAAAVQAAIWFFSDSLVLPPDSSLYALTSQVVADAIANGPAAEPTQPALSISPDQAVAPSTGEIVGPFTVTADGPSTLRIAGVEVFADQAGTQPLLAGDTVQPGAQLWLRSTTAGEGQGFALQRSETVQASTVYLYDNAISGRDSAQKLILAQEDTLEAVAGVRVTQFAAGAVQVSKTIGGGAAGLQDDIRILIVCTPPDGSDPVVRESTIPAGSPAGPRDVVTLSGLPEGSSCVVTEPDNGENDQVRLTASSIEPGNVTIVADETQNVAVTNEYERGIGGVRVTKTIGGGAAGLQDDIVIRIACTPPDGGDPVESESTIPAGTAAGDVDAVTLTDLPAGSTCVVTEPENGDNDQVRLTASSIDPDNVTIVTGETATVAVRNDYESALGNLKITKRIGGPAAGQQGEIVISVDCDGDEFDQTFTIPAETAEGDYPVSRIENIPVGTRCEVTESENGTTQTIVLDDETTIEPGNVTIAEDETREVVVTNRYREEGTGGGGGGGGFGGFGGGSSGVGYLPDAGAPYMPLALGIALVVAGGGALIAGQRSGRKRLTGMHPPM